MFRASDPFLFFDILRIPYEVSPRAEARNDDAGFAEVRSLSTGKAMRWPIGGLRSIGSYRFGDIPMFAHISADGSLQTAAAEGGWVPISDVSDMHGAAVASIWRQPDGTMVLPFDPNEAIRSYWMETYREVGGDRLGLRRLAVRGYYRIRPLLPRRVQLIMRRAYARTQGGTRFPRWPYEPALHDLIRELYKLVSDIGGEPPPWIAPWPTPYSWALVLTHDVETESGYRNLPLLRAVELATGHRSSWNFVPRRYPVGDETVNELLAAGFEVGVHGLYHDGRDLESDEMLTARLPEMRRWAERWRATGFRSPATQRRWDLIGRLGFDYDSSYADTARFEPQPGGSCSWFPFFIGQTVELPITMEQDHTLFVILGQHDAESWISKATLLRDRGGMALMITHPDYLLDGRLVEHYRQYLDTFAGDTTAWRALPRDVSAWWRRRAASSLVPDGDGWRVVGPGRDEASIVIGPPR